MIISTGLPWLIKHEYSHVDEYVRLRDKLLKYYLTYGIEYIWDGGLTRRIILGLNDFDYLKNILLTSDHQQLRYGVEIKDRDSLRRIINEEYNELKSITEKRLLIQLPGPLTIVKEKLIMDMWGKRIIDGYILDLNILMRYSVMDLIENILKPVINGLSHGDMILLKDPALSEMDTEIFIDIDDYIAMLTPYLDKCIIHTCYIASDNLKRLPLWRIKGLHIPLGHLQSNKDALLKYVDILSKCNFKGILSLGIIDVYTLKLIPEIIYKAIGRLRDKGIDEVLLTTDCDMDILRIDDIFKTIKLLSRVREEKII